MSSDRPRPPSVEALLVAVRGRVADGTDAEAVTAVARDVLADERARLAAGEPATDLERLADDVLERLGAFREPAPKAT